MQNSPTRQVGTDRVIEELLDAILVDIGGTIVVENPPSTPVDALVPQLRVNVAADLSTLATSVRLGAATNTAVMTESDVRQLLALVDIDRFLEVVVTSHDVGAAKPDPSVLLVAMSKLGIVDASRILYVGDRATDREAALRAGMQFAPITDFGLLASVEQWATETLCRARTDERPMNPLSHGFFNDAR